MQSHSAQAHIDTRALEIASEARQIAHDSREECRGEYQNLRMETNRRFDQQTAEHQRMHAENQKKFDQLFRALYIAIGIGTAITAGASVLPVLLRLH